MAHRVADPSSPDVTDPAESHARVLRITLLGYLGVVLVVTLWPNPPDPAGLGWLEQALRWWTGRGLPGGDIAVVEAVANVAMFVPLGMLLPAATRIGPVRAVAVGAGLSILIELVQLAFLPHRFATVQDVLMNALGAAVGAALLLAVRRRRARTGERHPTDPSSRGSAPSIS
jgi:glycopeptide antibiotics resistance protein